ncbi:MAG: hypothetical protein ABMB14_36475, partial [Myxococcota bacterium]
MWFLVRIASAAEPTCHVGRLDALAEALTGATASKAVAISAGTFEEACTGWSDVVEAAGDIAVVSPERRRAIDLAVATHDDRWREACAGGARALTESMSMTRQEGRAHLWDACALDALGMFTRDEWVSTLDGLVVLPLSAAVLLPEAGIDHDLTVVMVRGLAGLPGPALPAGTGTTGPEDEPAVADVADVAPEAPAPVPG